MLVRRLRYCRLALLIVAGALAALLAWPDTRVWIIGTVKGEPRYEGRPSSSWARQLQAVAAGDSPLRARELGPGTDPAVLAVYLEFLKHDDPHVRYAGASGLDKAAVAAKGMRPGEAESLRRIVGRAVPALAQVLDDPDLEVRSAAARTLWKLDPAQRESCRATVLAILQQEPPAPPASRVAALTTLVNLGPGEADVAVLVTALTKDEEGEVRGWAGICLSQMHPPSAAAVPALARALHDPQDYVRRHAIATLEKLGPAASPALAAVTAALRDSDRYVQRTAAKILGGLGPKAKAAVPALTALLRDRRVSGPAARALWLIAPEKAVGADPVQYATRLAESPLDENGGPLVRQYIDSLRARKSWSALLTIADAGIAGSAYALTLYSRHLDGPTAIALCKAYKVGSSQWEAALHALQYQPRKAVIGFVQQLAASQEAATRCHCYRLCRAAGWDDLADRARHDLNNDEIHPTPSVSPQTFTIGDAARAYLDSLRHKRPDAHARR